MLLCQLLLLMTAPPAIKPEPQGVPPYFVKIVQARTLFAANERAMIVIRLGNQEERNLKTKRFPDILENLVVTHGDTVLKLDPEHTSQRLYRKLKYLGYGAHKDFQLNLRRYFPDMKPGNIYKVSYKGPNYELKGKPISIAPVDLPDLNSHFVITTNLGDITIQLENDQTPNHARNFAILTAMQFYRKMIWHRVERGFVIQTGDPLGSGQGGSGFPLALEKSPFLKHKKYSVGMARADDPDSATSQFYICLNPQEDLDEGYTVFGKVVAGFDVVDAIATAKVMGPGTKTPSKPEDDVTLDSITIVPRETP